MTRVKTVVTRVLELTSELKRPPHPQGDPAAIALELIPGVDDPELKPERVQEWLQARPDWQLDEKGRMIHRVRKFPNREVAAQYSSFVTGLAASLALSVKVKVSEGQVALSLYSGRRGGRCNPLTENVLGFADQLG
jgi:pterin-4a-carbinolamine dehydratase